MKRTFYFGTTLLTTLLHSLCCLVPLLTTVLGASGTVPALAGLLPYQPYFWGLQALVLLGAFYHVYARPHRATSRGLVWVLALVSGFFSFVPHSSWFKDERQVLAEEQVQRVFDTRQLTLAVEADAQSLQTDLGTLRGVIPTQTAVRAGQVSLRYNRRLTNRTEILTALRERGYAVRLTTN